jgi:hypothetical protein
MSNFLQRIEDVLVQDKLGRAQGTGPISRIFSGVNLLILVYLLVYLLKDHKYIPLGILLILGFTRFGIWISIGLLVYFLLTRYWTGSALVFGYLLVGWLAVWLGGKNIRKTLHSGRADVDPFEGMGDMTFIVIFLLAFLGFALLTSGTLSTIFWILFGLAILYVIERFYGRLRPPWRRLHFPFMIRYSSIAGYQSALSETTGDEFEIKEALASLIKGAYPYMRDDEVNTLIESAQQKMVIFSDRELVTKSIRKSNPSLDHNRLQELLNETEKHLKDPNEKALYIRYVIAEIVSREYGELEREKYVHAIFAGRAT